MNKPLHNLVGPWRDVRETLRKDRELTLARLRQQRDALKLLVERRALEGEQNQLSLID